MPSGLKRSLSATRLPEGPGSRGSVGSVPVLWPVPVLQPTGLCQGSQHAKISKLTLNLRIQTKLSSPAPGFTLGFPETEFHPGWKLCCSDKVLKASSTRTPSTWVQRGWGMSQIPVCYCETLAWPWGTLSQWDGGTAATQVATAAGTFEGLLVSCRCPGEGR